jgi:NADPH-dependent 2,4-dienoyl-CoA reductase/sulfur reductase-like enzyme
MTDAKPHIAILGAGPTGLEAALAAAESGHPFTLYEAAPEAAALAGGACLAQTTHGADSLTNPEPGFFILGSKSYGRNNTFLMRIGWEQVAEVFGVIGTGS